MTTGVSSTFISVYVFQTPVGKTSQPNKVNITILTFLNHRFNYTQLKKEKGKIIIILI